MLKRISQWIADRTVVGNNRVLQERANDVRQIAQEFRLNIFPEVLEDTQDCSCCKRPQLLLVHPDLICYECLVGTIQEPIQ
jgi:hypothetical protein